MKSSKGRLKFYRPNWKYISDATDRLVFLWLWALALVPGGPVQADSLTGCFLATGAMDIWISRSSVLRNIT